MTDQTQTDDREPPRPRFDRQAFAVLEQASRQAMIEVPELVGVAVVCLWDFRDQGDLPTAALFMPDAKAPDPDQFLRFLLATVRFQQFLLNGANGGIKALRELTAELAKEAHEHSRAAAQGRTRADAGDLRVDPARPAAEAPG